MEGGAEQGEKKGDIGFPDFEITCIMLAGISVIFSGTSLKGGNTLKEKTKKTTGTDQNQFHNK